MDPGWFLKGYDLIQFPYLLFIFRQTDLSKQYRPTRPDPNLHRNGDVFNQRFVMSPRTGVLHACLSPQTAKSGHLCNGREIILFRIQSIKVLEVLRGGQLPDNSFYFAVLLQPLKFDFVSNKLRKDGICCRQARTFSSSDYCCIPEFFWGFFSAKHLFLLRKLNHIEDVETLLQGKFPFLAVKIHYFVFYLLLFLPPCKWINFLWLIWLMFSIFHRRTLHNLHVFYHEIFISTFWKR